VDKRLQEEVKERSAIGCVYERELFQTLKGAKPEVFCAFTNTAGLGAIDYSFKLQVLI
jgi:hypothetical protein